MRVQNVASACVVIEHHGIRVLCDPWLVSGAYYGAWYHNPPLTVRSHLTYWREPNLYERAPYYALSYLHI